MDQDKLTQLRDQILRDIVPLVLDNADKGSDQFSLLLRVIQAGSASKDIYDRAYESAKGIEDSKDRLEAFLSLVDEIDIDVNRSDEQVTDTSTAIETTSELEIPPPTPQEPVNENLSQGF